MMTTEEIDEFLNEPLIGAIGLLRADGSPAIAPVWYRWDGETITVWGDTTTWWFKRIAADPRVAFSVFEHERPYRAVYIRGTATVRHGSIEELMPIVEPITARYVAEGTAAETVRSYDNGDGKMLVTITPTSVKGIVNS